MSDKNLQRFVIRSGTKVIGTDSRCAFTEGAAHMKCALLLEEVPKGDFKVVEITRFFAALR